MLKKIYFNHLPITQFTAKNGNVYRRVIINDNTTFLVPNKIDESIKYLDICLYLKQEDYSYKIGFYPSKEQ